MMPATLRRYGRPARTTCAAGLALAACLAAAGPLAAQVSQDQAAAVLLNSARKAYNEHNYPFARDRFREFLQRFGVSGPPSRSGRGEVGRSGPAPPLSTCPPATGRGP